MDKDKDGICRECGRGLFNPCNCKEEGTVEAKLEELERRIGELESRPCGCDGYQSCLVIL